MGAEESPGKLKGRGAKTRKTRVVKREAYSRRDFKGFPNGEEIYDTITRLIDEEKIEPNKREGIFCTVFKHLQANARKSINFPVHEMTPDLGGSESLGTKELLAVLLSISRREVDKLVEHSTKELKVDVFVELSEGTNTLIRFPIRYYTTSEDLIGYVLKDRGVADSPLDYQLAVVKSPFKGKNKIKSMMCAVGANLNSPVAHKQARTLYPHQYPLQELGEAPKVIYTNNDVLPRVVSAYFYVTPREAQPLTVYHRRKDGKVEEDVLYLRTSVNANEVIEQCIDNFDLENDPIAYKLVMKTFEFDEKSLEREDQPICLIEVVDDCQDGYPQIWIEDQEVEEITRTNSFLRKDSSRRASRKKQRPVSMGVTTDPESVLIETPPKSSSEISKIQKNLYHASLRRKTQSVKDVSQIKEQENHLQKTMIEQEKLISALTSAVTTAEKTPVTSKSSISPQSSTKSNRDQSIDENKLKQALAEKQTQLWELEGNKEKDHEKITALTKANKSLEMQYKELEEKYRHYKQSAKNDIEIEKREKRELENELKLIRQNTVESEALSLNHHPENKIVEMQEKLDESKSIIDLTTRRNEELKEEIRHLQAEMDDMRNKPSDRLEVEGLVKSSMNESISINDFTEWSKDLDSLKKRNDQLLCRNKQLSSDNAKLTEKVEKSKSALDECMLLKKDNVNLKEAVEELKVLIQTKDAEISSLTERVQGTQEESSFDDYQEKYYEMYEKYQHLESIMGGTIDKLKSKVSGVEEEKVQLQNTINELNTMLDSKKRELKEFDYMKNRVEMMEMEHAHLKEFSSQLIEENKQIDEMKKDSFEKDQALEDLRVQIREQDQELVFLRGLEKANASTQADDLLVQDLESRLEEAEAKVDSRSAILDSLNGKISQREEEVSNMKNILSDFETTNNFMTGEIQKLQKQNSSLESKLNKRTEEIANFKDIMDALNEQISSSAKQCAEGNCDYALQMKELHAAEIKIMEDTMKDSKTIADKYSAMTGELTQLQSRYEYLEDEMSVMEADKADLEEQNDTYSQVIKDKDSEFAELLVLNSSLRDELDTANRKTGEITAKRDELAKEMVSARQQRADVELQLNELQDEYQSVKRKLTVAKDQLESLQTLNEAVTAQLREMQDNDCAKGTCPKSQELLKDIEHRDEEKKALAKQISDLQYQRKDLQEVIIRAKNDLAEKELELQELEGSCSEYESEIKTLKAQIRSLQRKIDPKKVKKDLVDNLENQIEMYQVEVMSLKSVTRNLEDQVDRMSVMEQETTDEMFELNKRNASLDKQLGDANEQIQDLEAQLEKLKEGIRESQKESAMVDTYLTERDMMKESIETLESQNKVLKEENDKGNTALTKLKEELSIIKGVRDIQTRDNATTKADAIKLSKDKDSLKHELVRAHSCIRKRDQEIQQLRDTLSRSNASNDISQTSKLDKDDKLAQSDLYATISNLSATVKNLTEENEALEGFVAETNNEEKLRQQKIAELEKEYQEDIEDVHKQYEEILEKKDGEIKHWVTRYQSLSQEYVVLEEQQNNLEKLNKTQPIPEQFEMQNALQEKEDELKLKSQMAEKTYEQLQQTQIQLEETEAELLTFKKKYNNIEKSSQDLSNKLTQGDQQIQEYKQRIEDMNTADENKRSEIRLLNKMIKEYTSKAEDAEVEYNSLKDKYKDKKNKIEQLQKEIMQLKNSNVEYENVIIALESTSASESLDVSTKTKRIAELEALLTETENDANEKISELESSRSEARRLQEENDQLVEEVKSYQDEWRRLTNLLNSVNHTNSANMDSCKRLENKLDDIEFKVTEANVHIDVCQGDMFSKTESLVRENGILEQKIAEKTQSLEQSEQFLRESHKNVSLLQSSLADAQDQYETLQRVLREKESKIDSLLQNNSNSTSVELQRKIRELNDELADKEGLLKEALEERKLDESSFKMSLDTIVRSYETKIETLTNENESKTEQINKLNSEIETLHKR